MRPSKQEEQRDEVSYEPLWLDAARIEISDSQTGRHVRDWSMPSSLVSRHCGGTQTATDRSALAHGSTAPSRTPAPSKTTNTKIYPNPDPKH